MLTASGRALYSSTTSSSHHNGQPVEAELPISAASSLAFLPALSSESDLVLGFLGIASGFNLARAHGNMLVPRRLVQSTSVTSIAKVNLQWGPPMALQSTSCSQSASEHPTQEGRKDREREVRVVAGARQEQESQRPDNQENLPIREEALDSQRRRLQREARSRRMTVIGQRPPWPSPWPASGKPYTAPRGAPCYKAHPRHTSP